MRKTILILLLCAQTARGETTLSFAAEVSDENLAEDSILLVHCLAERTGHGWEFTGEARGPLSLHVREENHELRGVYHKDGKDLPVALRAGAADDACDRLEPAARTAPELAPPSATKDATPALGGMNTLDDTAEPTPSRGWIWAVAGVAVVGGLLLWRSRQPSYRSVEMR